MIKTIIEELQWRKLKLLGHVLRRDRQHPLHQSTFSSSLALPRETEHRRVGRPRQSWTLKNMERAWDVIQNQDKTNVLGKKSSDKPITTSRHSIEAKATLFQPKLHLKKMKKTVRHMKNLLRALSEWSWRNTPKGIVNMNSVCEKNCSVWTRRNSVWIISFARI